jgi:hypothetical protein
MRDCKTVSRLLSEAMDRPLPIRFRLWIFMHVAMCRHCDRFRRQLMMIRRISCDSAVSPPSGGCAGALTDAAKQRLQSTIDRHCGPAG